MQLSTTLSMPADRAPNAGVRRMAEDDAEHGLFPLLPMGTSFFTLRKKNGVVSNSVFPSEGQCLPVPDLRSSSIDRMQQPWSDKELQILRDLMESQSAETSQSVDIWGEAARRLTSRSAQEAFATWHCIAQPHADWSSEEERKLIDLAKRHMEHRWDLIADELGTGRTPVSCLRHYQQALNGRLINSSEWTDSEDMILRKAVSELDESHWQSVSSRLQCRTASQCINRWHKLSTQSQTLTKEWTPTDDRRLIISAIAHGALSQAPNTNRDPSETVDDFIDAAGDEDRRKRRRRLQWTKIASFVDNKSDIQCRERWTDKANPAIVHSPFTAAEDELLQNLVQSMGENAWVAIARKFSGRTDSALRARFYKLMSERPTKKPKVSLKVQLLPKRHERSTKATIDSCDFVPQNAIVWSNSKQVYD